MTFLELKVPPVIVILVALATAYGLAQVPIASIQFVLPDYIVGLLLIAGAIIALLGVWQFRQARTTTNPLNPNKASSLVSSGIYRITRNPMYLGMVLVLCGGIIKFGSLLGFIALPLFVWYMTRFQIKPEERIIAELFGQEYLDYKQRVKRWI
jgi:protein-S-isoprenylcysteine O-methyltransferase Ste14